jgi:hypothetical protein
MYAIPHANQNNSIIISPFLTMLSECFFKNQNEILFNDFSSKMYFCFNRFILYLQEWNVPKRYGRRLGVLG